MLTEAYYATKYFCLIVELQYSIKLTILGHIYIGVVVQRSFGKILSIFGRAGRVPSISNRFIYTKVLFNTRFFVGTVSIAGLAVELYINTN